VFDSCRLHLVLLFCCSRLSAGSYIRIDITSTTIVYVVQWMGSQYMNKRSRARILAWTSTVLLLFHNPPPWMSKGGTFYCLVKNLTKEKPSGKKPWLREKEYNNMLPLFMTSLNIFEMTHTDSTN